MKKKQRTGIYLTAGQVGAGTLTISLCASDPSLDREKLLIDRRRDD